MGPVEAIDIQRCRNAGEHLTDVARLDREIDAVKRRIAGAVVASGTTPTELHGVGPVVAAIILGDVGMGACAA